MIILVFAAEHWSARAGTWPCVLCIAEGVLCCQCGEGMHVWGSHHCCCSLCWTSPWISVYMVSGWSPSLTFEVLFYVFILFFIIVAIWNFSSLPHVMVFFYIIIIDFCHSTICFHSRLKFMCCLWLWSLLPLENQEFRVCCKVLCFTFRFRYIFSSYWSPLFVNVCLCTCMLVSVLIFNLIFTFAVQLKCSGPDISADTLYTCQLRPHGPACPSRPLTQTNANASHSMLCNSNLRVVWRPLSIIRWEQRVGTRGDLKVPRTSKEIVYILVFHKATTCVTSWISLFTKPELAFLFSMLPTWEWLRVTNCKSVNDKDPL